MGGGVMGDGKGGESPRSSGQGQNRTVDTRVFRAGSPLCMSIAKVVLVSRNSLSFLDIHAWVMLPDRRTCSIFGRVEMAFGERLTSILFRRT